MSAVPVPTGAASGSEPVRASSHQLFTLLGDVGADALDGGGGIGANAREAAVSSRPAVHRRAGRGPRAVAGGARTPGACAR
ncbi:hypothetical protein D7M15_08580 [Streptomyces sp. Z26]|nr:hypothetical protein D7M15_08580 [Streptomyces sp. Z26]